MVCKPENQFRCDLLRIEKSTYADQHRVEHKCWRVLERVTVSPTGEYDTYEYYNSTVKNPKHNSPDGREWTQFVPTDYGGVSSWSRYENGERVKGETWVRDYRKGEGPHSYGLHPLIDEPA